MRRQILLEVQWDDVVHNAIAARKVADRLGEMIADCLDLMEARGSVSDPSVYATIAVYDDGTINDETGAEP